MQVTDGGFDFIEQSFREGGPDAVFDLLVSGAREAGDACRLFDARTLQIRHRLGLPLIQTGALLDLTPEQRTPYEEALRDAAREAGCLRLTAGDIPGAWPYFRAIGEHAPVVAAIEQYVDGDDVTRIIEIAFQEGVHPRKGYELILRHRGICNAITWFQASRDESSRPECLRLLVGALYSELASSLAAAVESVEGAAPPTNRVADLIAGRDWLFEGMNCYIDSTHVASVLRFATELDDPETLRMALEMADYGQHLDEMYHFRGDPPFEDIYRDHAVYLRAVLGEEVEAAIAHFQGKIVADGGTAAAEVLIELLARLGRYGDAIQASLEYFPDPKAPPMNCPTLLQLCQMAGDYASLRTLARERDDLLGFAAGVLQG
jgi:hypothetical protein